MTQFVTSICIFYQYFYDKRCTDIFLLLMHTHVILQVLATSVDVPSLITPHPYSLFHVRPHDFQADYYSLTILNCIHTHKLALYVSIPHAL